jgi:hypothetical protein
VKTSVLPQVTDKLYYIMLYRVSSTSRLSEIRTDCIGSFIIQCCQGSFSNMPTLTYNWIIRNVVKDRSAISPWYSWKIAGNDVKHKNSNSNSFSNTKLNARPIFQLYHGDIAERSFTTFLIIQLYVRVGILLNDPWQHFWSSSYMWGLAYYWTI